MNVQDELTKLQHINALKNKLLEAREDQIKLLERLALETKEKHECGQRAARKLVEVLDADKHALQVMLQEWLDDYAIADVEMIKRTEELLIGFIK